MTNAHPWLLCIHNIPPRPAYLRAKVTRRLAALGAVPVKNAVYVLPDGEHQRDGLLWLVKEIEQGGGRAYVCGASFEIMGGGLDDSFIKSLFLHAREKEYRELFAEFHPLLVDMGEAEAATDETRQKAREWMARLRTRFDTIAAIDFFGAPGRESVEGLLAGAGRWLQVTTPKKDAPLNPALYTGQIWVTRPGVHVDRMATAWLIRRFIDPEARFHFKEHPVEAGHIGFDMPGATFSHEGGQCTFEVMARRFLAPLEPPLQALCDIVHDIDLNEEQTLRPESAGVAALLHGLCLRVAEDTKRIAAGIELFDSIYEHFKRIHAHRGGAL